MAGRCEEWFKRSENEEKGEKQVTEKDGARLS
jgi:hypothetical protein